jgi:ACS family hexuronate transporter-like MFS transporter
LKNHVRWIICVLLFFVTAINYIDRQVFGVLAPALQNIIGWNEIEYGYMVTAFQAAYAIGLLVVGGLMDRWGIRLGLSLALMFWSLATMGHALVNSVMGFIIMRFVLGFSQAGNFPGAIKTVAEWFPRKERALATGIFNSGTNMGAIVAPLLVPWLAIRYGWKVAFLIAGLLGFVCLAFWLFFYRRPKDHPRLSMKEWEHIESDAEEMVTPLPWIKILSYSQTWAFVLVRFMTDPVWWFYLYWAPKFLNKNFGLSIEGIGLPLMAIYIISVIGSVSGGWLSSALIQRKWSINAARKITLLCCALCVVPVLFVMKIGNLWVVVALIGLATAAHQAWSANMFTVVSDIFPRHAVGSVVGLGGMAGAFSGMMAATVTGYILEWTHSYWVLFLFAGSSYLVALFLLHQMIPRLEPIKAILHVTKNES